MLYYANKPDPVLQYLTQEALLEVLDALEDGGHGDFDLWEANYPESARCFDPQVARGVIERLLRASESESVYALGEYQWLLLYESLKTYCAITNDLARDSGECWRFGEYQFREVDFDALLDIFFWDMDFLSAPSEPLVRKAMGMSDQVFGIAHGLAPHTEELQLRKATPSAWDRDEYEVSLDLRSQTYPTVAFDN